MNAEILSNVVIYVICLIMSIGVHEFCHAWAAERLGDSTPEMQGRLTLNPLVHADVIGTLVLPILAAIGSWPLLGWGRPVETSPRNYTRKIRMRVGIALVSVAGPLGNLALAVLALGLAVLIGQTLHLAPSIFRLIRLFVELNVLLLVFNLLPIHPLDGGKILAAYLPERLNYIDEFSLRFGPMILIALVIFAGSFLHIILRPFMLPIDWVWLHWVVPT